MSAPLPPTQGSGGGAPPGGGVREAVVVEKSRFSIVWLIPIIALLVGGYVTWRAFAEQGPLVTIRFESAEGMEAEKTKVRFKNVEIGVVEAIDITEDLKGVLVRARLSPGARGFLTENTRFWVVRARVTAGSVSGLGTLLSGAYIGVEPSLEGKIQRDFVGLEVPPLVTSDDVGRLFRLTGTSLGSIQVGSPVYFRHVRVGRVVSADLDPSGDAVSVTVFVESPHDARVRRNSVFWNASGLDVQVGGDGVQLDTMSVTSLLIGGVAFDTRVGEDPGELVEENHVFRLYDSRRESREARQVQRTRFLLYFDDESVGGLEPGSPVEFRGIRIGEVVDVRLVYDSDSGMVSIPILIDLESGMLELHGEDLETPMDRMHRFVARGLRARLKIANLLTGSLGIDLDFVPDAPPAEIAMEGPYPQLPTAPSGIRQLAGRLESIVKRVEELPIEAIGQDLSRTLANLEGVTGQVDQSIAPRLAESLARLESTLAGADNLVGPESATGAELRRLILDLAEAAASLRRLVDQLEREPESLLRGRKQ